MDFRSFLGDQFEIPIWNQKRFFVANQSFEGGTQTLLRHVDIGTNLTKEEKL